ncbi:hypothetical protein P152DRAFT_280018 [Eremomyces bilateralis CBS 781.70]|uniref:Extracellular membrane protein CFEM domain-containing protein n=1 Tax=Eremomyces bilateralis CBS 781.70 TaxID=1392243 RepID=A0A6G1G930_9PEZI|nr:uncharacterized protein P152DRAFT_280018 [Eremomyces bilateralis CBS 781.70]KAF1814588.1 hypothetical protein P152DRAFT_280018 [Eremomyces bilateralis CBS 781.70]
MLFKSVAIFAAVAVVASAQGNCPQNAEASSFFRSCGDKQNDLANCNGDDVPCTCSVYGAQSDCYQDYITSYCSQWQYPGNDYLSGNCGANSPVTKSSSSSPASATAGTTTTDAKPSATGASSSSSSSNGTTSKASTASGSSSSEEAAETSTSTNSAPAQQTGAAGSFKVEGAMAAVAGAAAGFAILL